MRKLWVVLLMLCTIFSLVSAAEFEKTHVNVIRNVLVDFPVDAEDFSINSVQTEFTQSLQQVTFGVEEYNVPQEIGVPPLDGGYKYIIIRFDGASNFFYDEAKIRFTVPRSFSALDESSTSLYYFIDNEWIELETVFRRSDSWNYYYEAFTPEVGVFGIGAASDSTQSESADATEVVVLTEEEDLDAIVDTIDEVKDGEQIELLDDNVYDVTSLNQNTSSNNKNTMALVVIGVTIFVLVGGVYLQGRVKASKNRKLIDEAGTASSTSSLARRQRVHESVEKLPHYIKKSLKTQSKGQIIASLLKVGWDLEVILLSYDLASQKNTSLPENNKAFNKLPQTAKEALIETYITFRGKDFQASMLPYAQRALAQQSILLLREINEYIRTKYPGSRGYSIPKEQKDSLKQELESKQWPEILITAILER